MNNTEPPYEDGLRRLPALTRLMGDSRDLWLNTAEGLIIRFWETELHRIPTVLGSSNSIADWKPIRTAVNLIIADMTAPAGVPPVAPWTVSDAAKIMDEYALAMCAGLGDERDELDELLRTQMQKTTMELVAMAVVRARLHADTVEAHGGLQPGSLSRAAKELGIPPRDITDSHATFRKQWRTYVLKHRHTNVMPDASDHPGEGG